MPPRPLPRIALAAGAVAVLVLLFRPSAAQTAAGPAPPDPAKYPKVRVEKVAGGAAVEGTLRLTAVPLKTETGSATYLFDHVRKVTFQRDSEGRAQDLVQLADKTVHRGEVTADVLVIDLDGGGRTELKAAEVREIRVVASEKLPLTAILFGLLALTAMEVILGVDNVIFLAIVVGKLPRERQAQARKIGLGAALGTRILLLLTLSWILGLTAPVFTLPTLGFLYDVEAREVSWRDIILLAGGLFLIGKSTREMHEKLESAKQERDGEPAATPARPATFGWTILSIAVIDIVFSLDSVITAVGMVEEVWVMIVAMTIAMLVMLYFAKQIGDFVDKHPTVKVLALSFLILIGVMLVAEGLGQHMDKGYIYAAMAFAVVVEMINMQLRKPAKRAPEPAGP
ncbi:MAG: tellurium resistance protein TerC [Isosphaera sp.]|nr:tellurium resistance protein TerC [Isosphaera sp.]